MQPNVSTELSRSLGTGRSQCVDLAASLFLIKQAEVYACGASNLSSPSCCSMECLKYPSYILHTGRKLFKKKKKIFQTFDLDPVCIDSIFICLSQ